MLPQPIRSQSYQPSCAVVQKLYGRIRFRTSCAQVCDNYWDFTFKLTAWKTPISQRVSVRAKQPERQSLSFFHGGDLLQFRTCWTCCTSIPSEWRQHNFTQLFISKKKKKVHVVAAFRKSSHSTAEPRLHPVFLPLIKISFFYSPDARAHTHTSSNLLAQERTAGIDRSPRTLSGLHKQRGVGRRRGRGRGESHQRQESRAFKRRAAWNSGFGDATVERIIVRDWFT